MPDGKDVAQQAKNSFIKDAAKAMPVVEGVKGAEKVADNTPDRKNTPNTSKTDKTEGGENQKPANESGNDKKTTNEKDKTEGENTSKEKNPSDETEGRKVTREDNGQKTGSGVETSDEVKETKVEDLKEKIDDKDSVKETKVEDFKEKIDDKDGSRVLEDGAAPKAGVGNTNILMENFTAKDVPTVKNNKFNEFFNSLSADELDILWSKPEIRDVIEARLRQPGGLHEWHLVSRTPQFKRWGVSAEQIKNLRTSTSEIEFVNPSGVHGGRGSTKAHNELLKIIDTSNDYDTFVRRLNNWANYRLKGGVEALPEGLQIK